MATEETGVHAGRGRLAAIGIGFNTALFAVVDAVLFKPLPVAAPDRSSMSSPATPSGKIAFSTSSYLDYQDLSAQNDVFDGLVGHSPMFAALNITAFAPRHGRDCLGNYFQVFASAPPRPTFSQPTM